MYDTSQLFDFMLDRVGEVGQEFSLAKPQAFARWFANLYLDHFQDVFISDGTKDGKVDLFLATHDDEDVQHYVINSKFTSTYNAKSPVAFYDEITRFRNAFTNRSARPAFLEKTIRPELRPRCKKLMERYDQGKARLVFITNHRRNENQYESVKSEDLDIFHLEDIVQFMVDHIEGAMPRTPTMLLTGIRGVLSADKRDTEVSTSIVFARLTDFMKYMQKTHMIYFLPEMSASPWATQQSTKTSARPSRMLPRNSRIATMELRCCAKNRHISLDRKTYNSSTLE